MKTILGTVRSGVLFLRLPLLGLFLFLFLFVAHAAPTETYGSGSLQLAPGAGASCNALFATPCARTNSRWLAETVGSLLNDAVGDPDKLQTVLKSITDQKLNRDSGFYPFVFDRKTGKCVAHGANNEFVGMSIMEIFDSVGLAYADPTALHERFMSAHHSWVSYLWSDDGREVNVKLAYLVNNITDTSDGQSYFLGVGFENEPLPVDLPCSKEFDRWCSLTNVRRLVGRAQFELEQAGSLEDFESAMYRISFDENRYKVPGGFYLFMYTFDGILKAHGLLHDSFGKTLSEIFVEKKLGSVEEGEALHETFKDAVSGDHPVAWVQYPWRDSLYDYTYTKVALLVEVKFGNELYYVAAGFRFSGMVSDSVDQSLDAPLGEVCSDQYNLPCSFQTAHQLSSHALAHVISSPMPKDKVFQAISRDPAFKHGNFYVFVYSFDSLTLMAHGGDESYVGMTLAEVFKEVGIPLNGTELHIQFRNAAAQGGGWVKYDWVNLANLEQPTIKKISYIFQITIDGEDYYGGIGFNHLRYPLEEFSEKGLKRNGDPIPCSRKFGLVCSEINARAILGQALAELILSSSEASAVEAVETMKIPIEDVLNDISLQDPNFSVNDFSVSVFSFDSNQACATSDGSGCAVAYGSNEEHVGLTWTEIIKSDDALTIEGALLHQNLVDASSSGSGVFTYPYNGTNKRAWVAQFNDEGESYYVVVDYLTADMGPTCLTPSGTNGCPSDMECTDQDDQSICQPIVEKSVWIPIFISIIAVLLVGSTVGYFRVTRKIDAMKKIDSELDDINQAVDKAKKRQELLIMERAALQKTPLTWSDSPDILVPVTPEDDEYWSVIEKMRITIPNVHISKLWRVQNKSLWSYYSFHKDRLEINNIQPNERRVWHGTGSLDPSIVYADKMDGFMMQFAAQGLWGRGIYFADKASYSKSYSHTPVKSQTSERPDSETGELEMFLTRLLVGKEVKLDQNRALTVPPVDIRTGHKFNTVTGNTAGSQVWIVYENGRAYPEYLVRYHVGSRVKSRSPYESKIEAGKSKRWRSSSSFELDVSTSNPQPSTATHTARKGFWEYLSESGWVAYDATNQTLIEKTFQDVKTTATSPSIVAIKGPVWDYEVDVAKMLQTNVQHPSSKQRKIRYT